MSLHRKKNKIDSKKIDRTVWLPFLQTDCHKNIDRDVITDINFLNSIFTESYCPNF